MQLVTNILRIRAFRGRSARVSPCFSTAIESPTGPDVDVMSGIGKLVALGGRRALGLAIESLRRQDLLTPDLSVDVGDLGSLCSCCGALGFC